MTQPAVTLYVSEWCPYCERAKSLLQQKQVAFSEINIEEETRSSREEMMARSNRRTVPQVFIGDNIMADAFVGRGRFRDRSGELDRQFRGQDERG